MFWMITPPSVSRMGEAAPPGPRSALPFRRSMISGTGGACLMCCQVPAWASDGRHSRMSTILIRFMVIPASVLWDQITTNPAVIKSNPCGELCRLVCDSVRGFRRALREDEDAGDDQRD